MKYEVFKNPDENEYAFLCIDEYADEDSPRDWDNLGTFITWMDRNFSPDDNDYRDIEDFYESFEIPKSLWGTQRLFDKPALTKMVILPVYAYTHSETVYSSTPFSCPWDSGFAGFIFVSYESIYEEYKCKRVTKKIIEKVKENLNYEISNYNRWLNDPIYQVTILNDNKEQLDCYSGYESDDVMKEVNAYGWDKIGECNNEDDFIDTLKGDEEWVEN